MNRFANLLTFGKVVSVVALAALSACGGGGGSSTTTTAATVPVTQPAAGLSATGFPNTGVYQLLLTSQGANTARSTGISLIHPNDRTVEYQIEAPVSASLGYLMMSSGTADVPNKRVFNIQQHSVLYIVGGDIKRLPLQALGTTPKAGLQAAGVSNLCAFAVDTNFATPGGMDYSAPLSSKFYAGTKGVDGRCGTPDDGQAVISFDAAGKPIVDTVDTSSTGMGPVVAVFRDPATLKPTIAVKARGLKVIASSLDVGVGETSTGLQMTGLSVKLLDQSIVGGTGWESAGHDSEYFYVFRNIPLAASSATSSWKLVRISKVNPAASLLATGTGNLLSATMGSNSILGTILSTATGFSLNKFSKTTPGLPLVLERQPGNSYAIASALSQGIFMFFRTFVVNGVASSTSVEMFDEATNATIYNRQSAFLFGVIRPDSLPFNSSLDVVGFTFTGDSLGPAGALGSSLIAYNAANRTATVVGQFPNAADFGSARGLALTGGTDNATFATGNVLAVSGTTILPTPRRSFSFNPSAAGSIFYTTSVE